MIRSFIRADSPPISVPWSLKPNTNCSISSRCVLVNQAWERNKSTHCCKRIIFPDSATSNFFNVSPFTDLCPTPLSYGLISLFKLGSIQNKEAHMILKTGRKNIYDLFIDASIIYNRGTDDSWTVHIVFGSFHELKPMFLTKTIDSFVQ